jgi:photosystem II stability/assembly factor-like uncharacterized protein
MTPAFHSALVSGLAAVTFALPQVGDAQSAITGALDRPALTTMGAGHGAVLLAAAHAGSRIVAVGERGLVLLSDDSGLNWRQAQVPVSVTLTAIQFVDQHQGWAVGHAGVVLTTVDGGNSWTRQFDGRAAADLILRAAKASGDAVALKEALRMVADGADKPFLDLHFFDSRRGLAVGAYNLAFVTEDGGSTWRYFGQLLDNPKALHLYVVRAEGDTLLIAGEQGLVFMSTDCGRNWRRITTPYKGTFFTAELLGGGHIVLAGLRGNLWRSTDGGAGWARIASPAPVSFTASARINTQEVLLANQAGALFRLKDDVVRQIDAPRLAPVGGLLPLSDGRLVALTARGAAVVPTIGPVQ